MIGWAYAALLSGNPIDIPDFDRPVTLQFNAAPNNPSNPHYCHDPSPSTLSNGSNRLYSGGLSHFTLGLLWHRLAPASCSNTGSSRMMHIPALVIDQLADHATKQGIRISRVDILMAMILQVVNPTFHATDIAMSQANGAPSRQMYGYSPMTQQPLPTRWLSCSTSTTYWSILPNSTTASGLSQFHGRQASTRVKSATNLRLT